VPPTDPPTEAPTALPIVELIAPRGAEAATSDIFPDPAARSGDAVELKMATAIIPVRTIVFFMIDFLIGFTV
jgi:hypothetical protein